MRSPLRPGRNVIAHEIGHLVLPLATHSPVGLMVEEMSIPVATTRSLFFRSSRVG